MAVNHSEGLAFSLCAQFCKIIGSASDLHSHSLFRSSTSCSVPLKALTSKKEG